MTKSERFAWLALGAASTWFAPLCLFGDVLAPLMTIESTSANGNYVASVTPGTSPSSDSSAMGGARRAPARAAVYVIRGKERLLQWGCDLKNASSPIEVRVSDDGASLIAIDDRGQAGYGDLVVAIYDKKGILGNYSLESITGVDKDKLDRMGMISFPHSRMWRYGSFDFFDEGIDGRFFVLWINFPPRWVAWDLSSGKLFSPNEKLEQKWNERARKMLIASLANGNKDLETGAVSFLGKLRREEDRPLLEAQLSSLPFHANYVRHYSGNVPPEVRFEIESGTRQLADSILSQWDSNANLEIKTCGHKYRMLGAVNGFVRLPDRSTQGAVWLYLIPESTKASDWTRASIKHVARINLALERDTNDVKFEWKGILPGKYWIKALRVKDEKPTQDGAPIARLRNADFESLELRVIEVFKGKTSKIDAIECLSRVVP